MVNRSRQSFKDTGDKSFEMREGQQYQSQQKPQGQNFNLLRHSVQQDNFISGSSAQNNNASLLMGQLNKQQAVAAHIAQTQHQNNIQNNSQLQQALSKSANIQK